MRIIDAVERNRLYNAARAARRHASQLGQKPGPHGERPIINLKPAVPAQDPAPIDTARLDEWYAAEMAAERAEAALRAYDGR